MKSYKNNLFCFLQLSEFSGVVKIWETYLARQERAFGAESKEVGDALTALGNAY